MMAEPGHDSAASGPRKKRRGRLLIIAAVGAVVIGGGGGAFLSGALDGLLGASDPASGVAHADAAGGEAAHPDPHDDGAGPAAGQYYDLPEFIVNMNTAGERRRFLRLRARLEVPDPRTVDRLETLMPRIVDSFQVYLRELRPADLSGSAGTFRLREELMRRVNGEIAPARVDDLLFVEVMVQ